MGGVPFAKRAGRASAAVALASGALVILVLILLRHDYWRDYNDTAQDSLASFHAHGFALAATGGVGGNPFVAKEIDISAGGTRVYNHWPSGFFAVLGVAIRVFGNTEAVGRTCAIAFNLGGAIFSALAFTRRGRFLLLSVPLLLLTPMGRDAIPFVFVDASLFFWLGVLLFLTSRRGPGRMSLWSFRAVVIVSSAFCQMILFFSFCLIWVSWLVRRDRSQLIVDLMVWSASALLSFLLLSWVPAGIAAGSHELLLQFLHRASVRLRYDEAVSFSKLATVLAFHIWYNLGPASCLLPLAWTHLVARKQWLLASLLPMSISYSVLLRNYTGIHVFANLILVFAAILTIMGGFVALAEELTPSGLSADASVLAMGCTGLLTLAVSAACAPTYSRSASDQLKKRYYRQDSAISSMRSSMKAIVYAPGNLRALGACNSFAIKVDTTLDENGVLRIAQFYLGKFVLDGANRSGTPHQCELDMKSGLIHIR